MNLIRSSPSLVAMVALAAQGTTALHLRSLSTRRTATSCDSTIAQARENLGFSTGEFPAPCQNSSFVYCYNGTASVASSGCGITFCDADNCKGTSSEIQVDSGKEIVLERSFDCGAEGGFRVQGSLTLNGNGYAVSTESPTTAILGISASTGATVMNVEIQKFNTGIELLDPAQATNSLVHNCNTGISVEDYNSVTSVSTVTNVYSIANTQWGILAGAEAMVAFQTPDPIYGDNPSLVACGNSLANVAVNLDSVDNAASSDTSLICTETDLSTGVCRSSNAYYDETCASAGYCG